MKYAPILSLAEAAQRLDEIEGRTRRQSKADALKQLLDSDIPPNPITESQQHTQPRTRAVVMYTPDMETGPSGAQGNYHHLRKEYQMHVLNRST